MVYLDFRDSCKVALLTANFHYTREDMMRELPEYFILHKYANTDIQELIDREHKSGEEQKNE